MTTPSDDADILALHDRLLLETVLDDDAIWAIARGPADAKNSFALLQGTLDQAPGPNPAYTPTPQCAAVMDSMAWRRLVGNGPAGRGARGRTPRLVSARSPSCARVPRRTALPSTDRHADESARRERPRRRPRPNALGSPRRARPPAGTTNPRCPSRRPPQGGGQPPVCDPPAP